MEKLSEASLTRSQQAWHVTWGQSLALSETVSSPAQGRPHGPGPVRIQFTKGRGKLISKMVHCLGSWTLGTCSKILGWAGVRQGKETPGSSVHLGSQCPSSSRTRDNQ